MSRLRLLSLASLAAGMVLGMGALALGNGGAQAQSNAVQATLDVAVDAWNDEDAATFVSYFTDEGLQAQFGVTRAEAVAAIQEEMEGTGPILSAEASDIVLAGGAFTAAVELQFAVGFVVYEEWEFVQTAEGLKIGANSPLSRPIPPGVPVVDMTLQEYAFVYNEAALQAADGNFAFSVSNEGAEEHEIIVFRLTGNGSLLDLLSDADFESEEAPEGIEFVAFGGFYEPGTEGTAVFDAPFAPGRYGLVCFIPAPNGVPHVMLGMASEFTISGGLAPSPGGGGSITPPNTGDAGLLAGGQGAATWLVLGIALTLVLAGTAGFARSYRQTGA